MRRIPVQFEQKFLEDKRANGNQSAMVAARLVSKG